ncbi:PhzF family phenazine biosynthesis protein [Longitalea luteola]|uniref:PhzF family phenazine biosynthesis protein n=1 Tax=Longitalea luteola TaxID=2812563 RepID=UPI001A976C92|nr:PhzF family phenazine biosynthesis protein [Longitalea luteola]
MKLTLYQIDAFTNHLFGGNPAAVIPLDQWISDSLMQRLAMENNLSETVFFVPSVNPDADYEIRWFTPESEINLCGHATLASAFVLFHVMGYGYPAIRFQSKSGLLTVTKNFDRISMDFPAWKPERLTEWPAELTTAMGNIAFTSVHKHRDYLIEVADEAIVQHCQPDFTLVRKLGHKVILTARGTKADFVSRFFAPAVGIDEDPVTGSAHAQLIPFWAEKLNKQTLHARQLSKRGGELWCEYLGDRVTIAGQCVFYMKGEIDL